MKKPTDEIKKLAEYAKHHIPEENKYDQEEYVKARRQKLMDSGVATALTLMAKHNSDSCKELIASVFLVLCEEQENRGKIVAAGGGKALIPLALEGTDAGRSRASQALAKIAISINPELAFPGQRVRNNCFRLVYVSFLLFNTHFYYYFFLVSGSCTTIDSPVTSGEVRF